MIPLVCTLGGKQIQVLGLYFLKSDVWMLSFLEFIVYLSVSRKELSVKSLKGKRREKKFGSKIVKKTLGLVERYSIVLY